MSNDNMIKGLVFSDPINEPWLLSMIYGPSATLGKQAFLEDLQKVGESFAGAWMCMGDFNSLLGPSNKKGREPISSSSTGGLKGSVNSVGLTLGGLKFPKSAAKAHFLDSSDHIPIVLFTEEEEGYRLGTFKFDEIWTREEASNHG